ncbi:MAG TPA: coenzyme F420-0:L-glutamate ligase [Solirubrobacteraceae bacterium]|jgi:coenzyme F420-0:L-glutamate ligase/coenzyme F420-1:gamma-L-glutamate ligase
MVSATALEGLPEIRHGDDVGELIAEALQDDAGPLADGDVVVIAHKVISKAEGRVRSLAEVDPTARATELAAELDKDPRHVQVILDESTEVLRAARGVLICVTRHGFVCANAGVDASNVPGKGSLLLLPEDPDASARAIRARLNELTGRSAGVLITDSFGRAWRHGQVDVAIGCAGLAPLEDWRGLPDATGREMTATWIAIADELAAAADLARTKDGAQPVVLVRGAHRHVVVDDGPGANALIRPSDEDLFR